MSDSHDSEAAGRIRAYLGTLPPDADPDVMDRRWADRAYELRATDLRAVLAENAAMRRQIAGLQTREAVLWYDDDHDRWRPSEFRTVAEAIDEEGGQLQWRDGSRLVGEWRPAEGAE